MDTAQLTLVRQPFDHPDFLFELKHDGFRALAHVWDGNCELISRRRNSYRSFQDLRDNLAKLKVKNAVIDGELVCLDEMPSEPGIGLFKAVVSTNFHTRTEELSTVVADMLNQILRDMQYGADLAQLKQHTRGLATTLPIGSR
jgi:ATP-dependent DNA ligase